MKTEMARLRFPRRLVRALGRWALAAAACAAALGQAQVVDTLGGGPTNFVSAGVLGPAYGAADGSTFSSAQFNGPFGITLDVSGKFLYVADVTNNAVRRLDLTGATTGTLITNVPGPVDVVVDGSTNVYVLTRGDGLIRKFDSYNNLISTNNAAALTAPTAMAADASGNFYVAELGGAIKRVSATNGAVTIVVAAGTLSSPQGIEVMDSGLIAIADTGNHVIRFYNPGTASLTTNIFGQAGVSGTNNGPRAFAKYNSPRHLARAGGDVLVVADFGNHQVRTVDVNGTANLLYGIPSSLWYPTDESQYILAGWADGNGGASGLAEAREPMGVVVDGSGSVYATEVYYHVIRKTTGTGLTGPSGVGGGGTGVTLNPPSLAITPSSGYFPMGQTITVASPSTNVYYTTDGTEPTTNSPLVAMNGGLGAISWRNATNDLTGLRVKAFIFSGTNSASTNLAGIMSSVNEIGVPGGLNGPVFAGVGSTVVVPVIMNLKSNAQVRTLQFRVEVTPAVPASPMVSDQFNALDISTNDFIQVVTSDKSGGTNFFSVLQYPNGLFSGEFTNSRGALISFIGNSANYSASRFAVVAMLKVPIPATATVGSEYSIKVLYPSATADTEETPVPIAAMASQTIRVTNISYIVGDTAQRNWYNAGDFGSGNLEIGDINNAFHASLGLRLPYTFTDAFDAMDVFPEDTAGSVGGDGQIRFLDWQTISVRRARLTTNNFVRSWSTGGVRTNNAISLSGNAPANSLASLPGVVWNRHAAVGALPVESGSPGATVNVPVYIRVRPGATVAGLQFLATIVPVGSAPAVTQAATFIPFVGNSRDVTISLPFNQVARAWDLGNITLTAQSSNLLGYVQFQIPAAAQQGSCYRVRFSNTDGAPNFTTQYDFESRSACVWVLIASGDQPALISDEWKTNFFGSTDSPAAAPGADPDGDGFTNLQEYLAGTNPTNALSRLHAFSPLAVGSGSGRQNKFQLLTAPGKLYVLECATNLFDGQWSIVSTNSGDGAYQEFTDSAAADNARFYRIRVLP